MTGLAITFLLLKLTNAKLLHRSVNVTVPVLPATNATFSKRRKRFNLTCE
jgi:hypothetical protein